MDDAEISNLASRLEEAANEGYTFVHMGKDHLVSNREGFLQCAALFLRAAVAPYSKEDSSIVDVDPKQMMIEDTDVFFSWFERLEESPLEQVGTRQSWRDRILSLFFIALYLMMLCCFVVGLFTLLGSLAHLVVSVFSFLA